MQPKQADKILKKIEELAARIESDKQLESIDPRYAITAKWIDTDITNVSLD
jgi:hypothetical protein